MQQKNMGSFKLYKYDATFLEWWQCGGIFDVPYFFFKLVMSSTKKEKQPKIPTALRHRDGAWLLVVQVREDTLKHIPYSPDNVLDSLARYHIIHYHRQLKVDYRVQGPYSTVGVFWDVS